MDNSKSKENQQVEPLRPCCACPDTRNLRDECIISFGEEKCSKEIENHKLCLKNLDLNEVDLKLTKYEFKFF